jgi:hypothetical protein
MSTVTRKQSAVNYTLENMQDCLCREAELEMYESRAKTGRERELCHVLASLNREIYRVEFTTLQLWHDLPPQFFDRFPDDFWTKLDELSELEGSA